VRIPEERLELRDGQPSRFEVIRQALAEVNLGGLSAAILVDDRDDRNLELAVALLSLAPHLPVTLSMFNESIAPHLQAANPALRILNPARVAAPVFVDALDIPINHELRYQPRPPVTQHHGFAGDRLVLGLVGAFLFVLIVAVAFFHFAEHLSWLDALYFVVVTTATVGYGDIALRASSATSKLAGIGLILASTVFIWLIFSLTVDRIIRRRVDRALGRHVHHQQGHVILCGGGKLGRLVGETLLRRGERVLVIEQSEKSDTVDYLRSLGADAYCGDARSPRVLEEAGVRRAKALYSLVANDFVNLEVGLNARSFDPKLRLVLRIFDESMARRIKEQLDIHLSYSMSAIADEKFLEIPAASRVAT
jgi:voltage-gated potassium channel Kch